MKKLTLSLDESLIEFAHDYAAQNHTSISSILSAYLTSLRNQGPRLELSEPVERLYGAFAQLPTKSKAELRRDFHEKNSR